MENKSSSPRTGMLQLTSARSHARLARQLALTSGRLSGSEFSSTTNRFGSMWSPLRLDLLKTPVTRLRE